MSFTSADTETQLDILFRPFLFSLLFSTHSLPATLKSCNKTHVGGKRQNTCQQRPSEVYFLLPMKLGHSFSICLASNTFCHPSSILSWPLPPILILLSVPVLSFLWAQSFSHRVCHTLTDIAKMTKEDWKAKAQPKCPCWMSSSCSAMTMTVAWLCFSK